MNRIAATTINCAPVSKQAAQRDAPVSAGDVIDHEHEQAAEADLRDKRETDQIGVEKRRGSVSTPMIAAAARSARPPGLIVRMRAKRSRFSSGYHCGKLLLCRSLGKLAAVACWLNCSARCRQQSPSGRARRSALVRLYMPPEPLLITLKKKPGG